MIRDIAGTGLGTLTCLRAGQEGVRWTLFARPRAKVAHVARADGDPAHLAGRRDLVLRTEDPGACARVGMVAHVRRLAAHVVASVVLVGQAVGLEAAAIFRLVAQALVRAADDGGSLIDVLGARRVLTIARLGEVADIDGGPARLPLRPEPAPGGAAGGRQAVLGTLVADLAYDNDAVPASVKGRRAQRTGGADPRHHRDCQDPCKRTNGPHKDPPLLSALSLILRSGGPAKRLFLRTWSADPPGFSGLSRVSSGLTPPHPWDTIPRPHGQERSSPSNVRVRFAPSPTGYLHVGGARTALFNWLFARKHGGTFILRIEDTDLERSSTEVIEAIIDGLTLAGLDWDEGPYLQSNDVESHKKAAPAPSGVRPRVPVLLHPGRPQAAPRGGRAARPGSGATTGAASIFPRRSGASTSTSGTPHVLRFRVPDGETTFNDFVHGPTVFRNEEIEDFVLLRSDGTPTYHLSVVTDDIAMEITHIIRGDDHFRTHPSRSSSTARSGWSRRPSPTFPSSSAMTRSGSSKRHGAVSVLEYREMGIVPDAMFNFLALLGWSPGGDMEVLSRDDLVRLFSFEGIGKAGAVFDIQKLTWLSGQYVARASAAELAPRLRIFFEKAGLWDPSFEGERRAWFVALVELFRPRCRTYVEFVDAMRPFLSEDFDYEEEAARKHFKDPEVLPRLRSMREALASLSDWGDGAIEASTRALAESLGLSAGKLIHPTRVALTGRGVSPGLFEVMVALGRDRTLARLDRAITHVGQTGQTAVH